MTVQLMAHQDGRYTIRCSTCLTNRTVMLGKGDNVDFECSLCRFRRDYLAQHGTITMEEAQAKAAESIRKDVEGMRHIAKLGIAKPGKGATRALVYGLGVSAWAFFKRLQLSRWKSRDRFKRTMTCEHSSKEHFTEYGGHGLFDAGLIPWESQECVDAELQRSYKAGYEAGWKAEKKRDRGG